MINRTGNHEKGKIAKDFIDGMKNIIENPVKRRRIIMKENTKKKNKEGMKVKTGVKAGAGDRDA